MASRVTVSTAEWSVEMPDVHLADNDKIAELMDVSTGACTLCGGAAKVPEDVLAVVTTGDNDPHPAAVIVCETCLPELAGIIMVPPPGGGTGGPS